MKILYFRLYEEKKSINDAIKDEMDTLGCKMKRFYYSR